MRFGDRRPAGRAANHPLGTQRVTQPTRRPTQSCRSLPYQGSPCRSVPEASTPSMLHPRGSGAGEPRRTARPSGRARRPRPPCGGRHGLLGRVNLPGDVSIRAPRAGGDQRVAVVQTVDIRFNPRPPCGGRQACLTAAGRFGLFQSAPPCGGRHGDGSINYDPVVFQSAPPVRGATPRPPASPPSPGCFNPRPPCGGRPMAPMWTPPWLASTTLNEGWHVGQVPSYVRPLDAALVGRGPVWFP